jgi:hypothetical protein
VSTPHLIPTLSDTTRDELRQRLEDRWRAHVVELVDLSLRLYDDTDGTELTAARLSSVRAAIARIEAALERVGTLGRSGLALSLP